MPISSSVFAGFRFSYALPDRESTHSPLMKFLNTLGATAVAILPPELQASQRFVSLFARCGLDAALNCLETKSYRRFCVSSNYALPQRMYASLHAPTQRPTLSGLTCSRGPLHPSSPTSRYSA